MNLSGTMNVILPGIGPGDRVAVGNGIEGMVEEVIFARGMTGPFVLVEYWHAGELVARRFHAADCRKLAGAA